MRLAGAMSLTSLAVPELYGQRVGERMAGCFSTERRRNSEMKLCPTGASYIWPISHQLLIEQVAAEDGQIYAKRITSSNDLRPVARREGRTLRHRLEKSSAPLS